MRAKSHVARTTVVACAAALGVLLGSPAAASAEPTLSFVSKGCLTDYSPMSEFWYTGPRVELRGSGFPVNSDLRMEMWTTMPGLDGGVSLFRTDERGEYVGTTGGGRVEGTPAMTWHAEVFEDTNGDFVRDPGETMATAELSVAACPFDAAGDADGDRVPDGIDYDAGTGRFSFVGFSDDTGDYRKTSGYVVDAGGLHLTFADAADPRGVRVSAGSGTGGPAVLSVCGGMAELEVPAGASLVVTCGSVSVSEVVGGRVTVRLPGGLTTVAVPAGSEATVDTTPAGGFVVTGVSGTVALTVDGVARTISTGQAVTGASWDFVGFTAPVDNGGVLNVVNAGRTVPLKWRLLHADGSPMTTLGSAKVTAAHLSCVSGAPTDDLEQTTTEASGLKNLGNGYYQFNWATPKDFANSCRALRLDVGDGVVHEALFKFTR